MRKRHNLISDASSAYLQSRKFDTKGLCSLSIVMTAPLESGMVRSSTLLVKNNHYSRFAYVYVCVFFLVHLLYVEICTCNSLRAADAPYSRFRIHLVIDQFYFVFLWLILCSFVCVSVCI